MLITDVRRTRLALAALLGVLTILFGVGLMGTAGYLISRAAEHPAVLSAGPLRSSASASSVSRGLWRGILERLASHDVALRSLGRARAQVYRAVEPLAPAQLEDTRRGDLLSRFVGDVDSLQNLYLRGLEPPLVALIAGTASVVLAAFCFRPTALVLGIGPAHRRCCECPSLPRLVSRRSSRGLRAGARRTLGRACRDTGRERRTCGLRPRAGSHFARCAEPTRGSYASPAGPRSPTASATDCASS